MTQVRPGFNGGSPPRPKVPLCGTSCSRDSRPVAANHSLSCYLMQVLRVSAVIGEPTAGVIAAAKEDESGGSIDLPSTRPNVILFDVGSSLRPPSDRQA